MTHFYLRLLIIPFLLFTAALLVIHAQPYDDHKLRQILLPDGCPGPCFMGIRPNVTTVDEAEHLLRDNKWVEKITFTDSKHITWRWSGQQPDWINQETEGLLSLSGNQVSAVQFATLLPFGNVPLSMGNNGFVEQSDSQWGYQLDSYGLYEVGYQEHTLHFIFTMDCLHHIPYLQPVSIIIGHDAGRNNIDPDERIRNTFLGCSR